jgi:hypothetical protein
MIQTVFKYVCHNETKNVDYIAFHTNTTDAWNNTLMGWMFDGDEFTVTVLRVNVEEAIS